MGNRQLVSGHSGELDVEIEGHSEEHSRILLGATTIPLKSLQDQFKHQQWFEFFDPETNSRVGFKVHLCLQWIHSEEEHLRTLNGKIYDQIDEEKADLADYEAQLKTFYQLAPGLNNFSHQRRNWASENPVPIGNNLNLPHVNFPSFEEVFKNIKELFHFLKNSGNDIMANQEIMRYSSLNEQQKKPLLYIGAIWLGLSLLTVFNRPNFLDVIIPMPFSVTSLNEGCLDEEQLGVSLFYVLSKISGREVETHPLFVKHGFYFMSFLFFFGLFSWIFGSNVTHSSSLS